MAIVVKVTCPQCGPVSVHPAGIVLMVCTHTPLSHYIFTCPDCGEQVKKPADHHPTSPSYISNLPAKPANRMDNLDIAIRLMGDKAD